MLSGVVAASRPLSARSRASAAMSKPALKSLQIEEGWVDSLAGTTTSSSSSEVSSPDEKGPRHLQPAQCMRCMP
ncbi:MAG: hypothetical protein SGPRY_009248 [Prymnesium sp.]